MKFNEKLLKKYATNTVILPPPPSGEDLLDTEIPVTEKLPFVEDPDLEELKNKLFIFDEDQPKIEAKKRREAEAALAKELEGKQFSPGMSATMPPPGKKKLDEHGADFMLPPAPERASKLPPMRPSSAPDIDAIQKAHSQMVEEMEGDQGSRDESLDALLKSIDDDKFFNFARVNLDRLIKVCSKFYDLCCKF